MAGGGGYLGPRSARGAALKVERRQRPHLERHGGTAVGSDEIVFVGACEEKKGKEGGRVLGESSGRWKCWQRGGRSRLAEGAHRGVDGGEEHPGGRAGLDAFC